MIRILYFARLKEALGTGGESVSAVSGIEDVGSLIEWLRSRGGPWSEELAPGRAVRVAVNREMAQYDTVVGDGDEVAFFPPVTGG
ncbi:MAG: molybdopterin converting factor subunit 1 [Pseudomonadota bacterium]